MALVSGITKRVDIPHEPDEWMEFRKLSWRQMELANEIAMEDSLKRVKSLGGDMLKALRESATQQNQPEGQQYDRAAVLQAGIVRWSYDAEVTNENIDLLDEETAVWAFGEILELNAPRDEADRKNA